MNFDSNAQNLITPEDLTKILNISKSSVYRLVDNRSLPFYKVGGNLRFSLTDIDSYLKEVRIESISK